MAIGILRAGLTMIAAACAVAAYARPAGRDARHGPPSLGLLIPVGPPEYKPIFDNLAGDVAQQAGPFTFHVGRIGGVPVVVSIAPQDGPLMRSLAAQAMLQRYDIRAFVYPGTSGAHLGPKDMRIGDIVLGAANVDFGNFFMDKEGNLTGNEFGHEESGRKRYETLYLDPRLLTKLACSARRVRERSPLPGWLNPGFAREKPDIFYYGVQGTSTMWLANPEFMAKTDRIYHEIDEDGDWYSNLVATLYGVPFIEVSTIADSILELPDTDRGIPASPAGSDAANVVAQRLSDAVMLDLIRHEGQAILAGAYSTPVRDPFPAGAFAQPKDPGRLLAEGNCGS